MSTARFNTWLNSAGTEEYFKCRAWVNFNGTGTVAIRASGNVASITDNGPGDYTINFTTAMPDANFVTLPSAGGTQASTAWGKLHSSAPNTTSSTRINIVGMGVGGGTYTNTDSSEVHVAVFR